MSAKNGCLIILTYLIYRYFKASFIISEIKAAFSDLLLEWFECTIIPGLELIGSGKGCLKYIWSNHQSQHQLSWVVARAFSSEFNFGASLARNFSASCSFCSYWKSGSSGLIAAKYRFMVARTSGTGCRGTCRWFWTVLRAIRDLRPRGLWCSSLKD